MPTEQRLRRLTRDAANDRQATWSPDGATMAFVSKPHGRGRDLGDDRCGRRSRRPELVPASARDRSRVFGGWQQDRVPSRKRLWVANADGTQAARIPFAPTSSSAPSWQSVPAPDIAVSQTVLPATATLGGTVAFTVTVANHGSAAATSVVLTDKLPAQSSFVSATTQAGACSGTTTLQCNLGGLAVAQSVTVVVTITARASGTLVNSAGVATQPVDFLSSNDHADGSVAVSPSGDGCTILGTAGDDTLTGTSAPDVICGLGGNDVLVGGNGKDRLIGGSGNDRIDGGAGNDTIAGGDGNDRIVGGNGNDVIDGGSGRDTIAGGSGTDHIAGGADADTVHAGQGADVVDGGPGADVLDGGTGNDVVRGAAGNDRIAGGSGADTVAGGAGADHVGGGTGSDRLRGDAGRDQLFGGAGTDVLAGDAGNDLLVGGSGSDKISGGLGDDRINSLDGRRDRVSGGAGSDSARADHSDALSGIERRLP